jgi:hypothetical protein
MHSISDSTSDPFADATWLHTDLRQHDSISNINNTSSNSNSSSCLMPRDKNDADALSWMALSAVDDPFKDDGPGTVPFTGETAAATASAQAPVLNSSHPPTYRLPDYSIPLRLSNDIPTSPSLSTRAHASHPQHSQHHTSSSSSLSSHTPHNPTSRGSGTLRFHLTYRTPSSLPPEALKALNAALKGGADAVELFERIATTRRAAEAWARGERGAFEDVGYSKADARATMDAVPKEKRGTREKEGGLFFYVFVCGSCSEMVALSF